MKVDAPAQNLNRYFEQLKPHINPILLPDESLRAIKNIAGAFPSDICNVFGFESRLSRLSKQTDFAINLTTSGSELLVGASESKVLPDTVCQDAKWKRISCFLEEWGKTNDKPFSDANCLWLEFDLEVKSSHNHKIAPGLILFGYWLDSHQNKMVVHRPLQWLTGKALPLLRGNPLPSALEENFLRCLELAPRCADYFQIGAMVSRQIDALRLCVFNLRGKEIIDYLLAIGWQGCEQELAKTISDFGELVDSLCLHVDIIGESVAPRVGIELLYDHLLPWQRQPNREPRWYQLFDRLVEQGMCDPSKRDALLAWPGFDRLEQSSNPGLLLRGLQHIKLVSTPHAPLEAKAYFGAGFNPAVGRQGEAEK